jgi:lipopolysaccharide transport system ATP-binding protein
MTVLRLPVTEEGRPQVELRNVSRMFTMRRERSRSIQEVFIRMFRGQKTPRDVFWPLRDVTLSIGAGDSVGIIGPNGSGKSTLLKLVTGILEPSQGDMVVAGRVSSLLELGAGFQLDLTGRENIYLNASIYGLSRAQTDERIDQIIDFAELGEFIDTPVKHYSSGMYVRLGFAVAIHTDPDLLLVDEVLAVGDIAFQRKCLNSIFQFRNRGGTLLLVSHDIGTIQSICTRAVWLEDGEIQAEGNCTDVVMAYQQHVTAKENAKAQAELEDSTAQQSPNTSSHGNVVRWGDGELRITGVRLCDSDGVEKSNFFTGDELQIHLHYQCERRIHRPVFGLAIHTQSGINVYGPNTKRGGMQISYVEEEGAVVYRIPRLPLLEGGYTVSVAAVNFEDTRTFDYHDRAYTFQVYPGRRAGEYGLVVLDGEWQLKQQTEQNAEQIPDRAVRQL